MLGVHAPYGKREHHINQEKKGVCLCTAKKKEKRCWMYF